MCFYGGHSTGYKLGNHPKNIEPCAHRACTVRAPCDNAPLLHKEGVLFIICTVAGSDTIKWVTSSSPNVVCTAKARSEIAQPSALWHVVAVVLAFLAILCFCALFFRVC